MFPRTIVKTTAAAAAVGALAWFATRKETRYRAFLVRNVVAGWPVVAFTRIHGTVDLAGTRRPAVHDCDVTPFAHRSRSSIYFDQGTTKGRFTNLRLFGAGIQFGEPAGADPDAAGPDAAGPDTGGAEDEASSAREKAISRAARILWEIRPSYVREMPHDDQVKWTSEVLLAAFRAIQGDVARQAGQAPDDTPGV